MARKLFRGAPEFSRLFAEAPFPLITEFLSSAQFSEFLSDELLDPAAGADESARREAMAGRVRALRADRLALIEAEARRITAKADPAPAALLLRLVDTPQFAAFAGVRSQRDPLARSLTAYLRAAPLFDAVERTMQMRAHREHRTLYESWSIDTPVPLTADAVEEEALAEELAARLHHDEGCRVEAVDLPAEEGESREVLIAVTFFGAYASQKTVRPDKTTEILYFRPPDELLLVYAPERRQIEVCFRDPSDRLLAARIFAEEALKHDVLNNPLTQKIYDLSRFRRSLTLPIPDTEAHRVSRACITEVQVALGEWTRKATLSVAPEDDIDGIARGVFGAIIPVSGGGFITRLRFHIEHVTGRGRKGTLKFDLLGRNKSTIQSERDPAKRALGYRLLEAWSILERVGNLTARERSARLPALCALYDLVETTVSGRVLDDLGIDPAAFVRDGFLARTGWSEVILFEDDELGEVAHNVESGTAGKATLTLGEGGSGPEVPIDDVSRFEIRVGYLADTLREAIKPLGLTGREREIDSHLRQIGTVQIGLGQVPVYLARGLSDDRILERAERLLRGEGNRVSGIVFVPRSPRFPYLGCHVVLGLEEHLDPETGEIDTAAVRIAYEASIDPAANGVAVHFRKQGEVAAQLVVPGQDPRIVTGPKKVRLFERLYMAHLAREPGVKLSVLKAHAGFSQLQQLFGPEWPEVKDRYLYSPRRSLWALCAEPISV